MRWIRNAALSLVLTAISLAQSTEGLEILPLRLTVRDPGLAVNRSNLFVRQPGFDPSNTTLRISSTLPVDPVTHASMLVIGFGADYDAPNLDQGSTFLTAGNGLSDLLIAVGIRNQQDELVGPNEVACFLTNGAQATEREALPPLDIPLFALPLNSSVYLQIWAEDGLGGQRFSDPVSLIRANDQAQALNTTALDGEAARSLAVGDLNGDGIDDLVVGAPLTRVNGVPEAGRVLIFLGTPSGLSTVPFTLSEPNLVQLGLSVIPPQISLHNRFGSKVLIADVNGGGVPDLVIAAVNAPAVGGGAFDPKSGSVYVIDGEFLMNQMGSAPASPTPIVPDLLGGNLKLCSINAAGGAPIFPSPNANFGYALDSGDYDGDGLPDLAISAVTAEGPALEANAGAVFVYHNANDANFFNSTQPFFWNPAASLVASEPQHRANGLFGYSMTSGDYQNLAQDLLVVGAPAANSGNGRSTVFAWDGSNYQVHQVIRPLEATQHGLALATGDLNGDGTPELAVSCDDWDGDGASVILHSSAGGQFQETDILNGNEYYPEMGLSLLITDLNDDGIDDLVSHCSHPRDLGSPAAAVIFGDLQNGVRKSRFRRVLLSDDQVQEFTAFAGALAVGRFTPGGAPTLLTASLNRGATPILAFPDLLGRQTPNFLQGVFSAPIVTNLCP